MNYKKIYYNLCNRSLTRTWQKFTYEKHHVLPKSLGGTNEKSNIAILTPREHALAHLLLIKFLTGTDKAKMVFALKGMIGYRNSKRNQLNSKQYDKLRKAYQQHSQTPEYSNWRSEITKSQWTEERKKSVSEKAKQQWINGTKRQIFSSQEYKNKKSIQMKQRWQDPNYQKQVSDWTKAQWKDPTKKPNRNII